MAKKVSALYAVGTVVIKGESFEHGALLPVEAGSNDGRWLRDNLAATSGEVDAPADEAPAA